MATSGRIKNDYVNGGYTFALDWEVKSQSISDNTSAITVTAKLISNGASYDIDSSVSKDLTLTINGKSYSTTVKVGLNGNQTKTLFTKTVTVAHDSEGAKTCAISGKLDIEVTLSGTYYASFNASGSAVLNTIPRQSSIASVTDSVSVDGTNALAVRITRKVSSFTHTVRIKFGAKNHYINNVGTSASYVIPQSWLEAIPNSTSGTGTVFVTTYDADGNQIGSTVSKGYKLTVPSSVKPTFNPLEVTRIDGAVPEAWGIYVQGHSRVRARIVGAAGAYGSTIKQYSLEIGGLKANTDNLISNYLETAGTVTIRGTVTDSRGRTYSRTASITVQPYQVPAFEKANIYRALHSGVEDDEGTYIGGQIDFTYSNVGQNQPVTLIEYKLPESSTWVTAGGFTDNVPFALVGGLSIDRSYDLRITIADTFAANTILTDLPTGFTLLDFRKGGKGIAVGKVSENDDEFDIGLKVRLREGVVTDYSNSVSLVNDAEGFTTRTVYISKCGQLVNFYMIFVSQNAIAAGNTANYTVGSVPASIRPIITQTPLSSGGSGTVCSGYISAAGNIVLAANLGGINAGAEFSLGGTYVCSDTSGTI